LAVYDSVVLSLAFYGVPKSCEVSKRFNFHFCHSHYFGYAELLQMIIDEFGNQNRDLTV